VPEEAAIVQACGAAGFAVAAGERFRVRTGPAIRVTIARLPPARAAQLARAVADCLGPDRRSAPA
jgi:hypothetical protein